MYIAQLLSVYVSFSTLLFIFCLAITLKLFLNWNKSALRNIPGPFLASISDLWLFQHAIRRRGTREYQLHRKYDSKLLRLGPNTISVADVEASRVIYGWKPVFKKSRLYISQIQTDDSGKTVNNLSSEMNELRHGQIRRPVASAYAMSSVLQYEGLIDNTSRTFMNILQKRFAEPRRVCKLATYMQWYAFDVIGEMTFSKQFGFLHAGKDLNNIIKATGNAMDFIGMAGQLPDLDELLRIKILGKIRALVKSNNRLANFTDDQIREHSIREGGTTDFLSKFKTAQIKYPELVSGSQLAEYTRTNIAAGSDTTAIALRELVYRMLIDAESHERFLQEIRQALLARASTGTPEDKPITWLEGSNMIYFQACLKECLRIHPPLGQLLPREVPTGGIKICDTFLPEGTIVGCNAWTIHRDKDFWGIDADEFKPERWLDKDHTKIQRLEGALFAFGGGPRVCVGKNIALLEIAKLIPELFRRFKLELVEPSRYKLIPGWLVVQEGLDVRLEIRDPASFLLAC